MFNITHSWTFLCFVQLAAQLEIFLVAVKEYQAGGVADTLISETDEPAVNNSEQWQPTSALVHSPVR